ncbi:MAG TPA: GAF and ANTAR domain-containing protein [Acidimicrobiales bacterium]|nr:GAF and ANTAR domain-containing protein [Acidimicrobiales bacterium]
MADERATELAETLAEVARSLQAEEGVQATLTRICELAVQTIDGCDHAGVSLIQGRTISTPAASDETPVAVDAIQYEANEGPCLMSIREHDTVLADDLATEERWPRFAQRAVDETGVRSMLSFRLFVQEGTMGALNLYSRKTEAFDEEAVTVGSVFAAHAAVALSHAQREAELRTGMATRDVIGQAKGILMVRQGIGEDEAFELLRRASQRLNVKLRDIAEQMTKQVQGN